MNRSLTALALIFASTAAFASSGADTRIAALCGPNHTNELTSATDVQSNPDGYYIRSLKEQVSLGDPRIVISESGQPYLCTRSAATPDMDAVTFALHRQTRVARWLFVPAHPFGR